MKIQYNVPLKDYATLHIGGPAAVLKEPESLEEMQQVLKEEDGRLFVLGNGSNVLFTDKGYDGTILKISPSWNGIERLEGDRIRVQSGAQNWEIADFAAASELGGYEFACGVPGMVGGAIRMNAGCYGSEIKDVLESVRYLDREGNLHEMKAEDAELGYRHSWFADNFGVIVDAVLQLHPAKSEDIQATMRELQEKRYSKQPMDAYSCGSTFKRPEGHFAAALIDESGLRGYRVGEAQVSEKHTGFLINRGEATSEEFLQLIEDVRRIVAEKTGVELTCEVFIVE